MKNLKEFCNWEETSSSYSTEGKREYPTKDEEYRHNILMLMVSKLSYYL
jgi:hypothetical protein